MTDVKTKTIRTMCPMNCHPTQCGMLVEVEDGKLISVKGDPDNPDSQGFLCIRGQASKEIIGNPKRVVTPMMRDRRDDDAWREATWDEALDRIADKMESLRPDETGLWAGHGILSNGYGVYAAPQMVGRFANLYGCQTWTGAMICWGLGGFGAGLTGVLHTNTKMDMAANAEMILMWAANFASQPTTTRFIMQAKKRGAKLVVIDVRETEAMAQADQSFIIHPGTDSALALGLMHVIIKEGLHDADFIVDHTVGFDELSDEVGNYPPERVAEITGIDASRIVELARDYATTKPAMIHLGGSSILKGSNGWRATRAITCLPALTGNLGIPGGGFGPRHGTTAQGAGLNHVVAADKRPAGNYIPNQMSEITAALNDGRVKAMLIFGSNMMSSYADSEQVARALGRLELVVTHELFMTETARRFADIVLPATAWLEDLGAKSTHTHIYLCEKGLEPAGQARPIQDVFKGLSERLGVEDYYPWASHEEFLDAILDHPSTGGANVAS
ncbi:MAG: molybdopterin-dependent oxidoreductase, partial [Proteobacteria bacterium]|nr:molybdopterin-dependent oxidoreductase [Pseudomonadota bacterium]